MTKCEKCGSQLIRSGFGLPLPWLKREGAWYRDCDECGSNVEFVPTDAERDQARKDSADHRARMDFEADLIEKYEEASVETQTEIKRVLGLNDENMKDKEWM